MTPHRLICADVITGLRQIEAETVHCVVTSPPYWGLRNYGIEPSIWGGDPQCRHEWGSRERGGKRGDILPFGESSVSRLGTRDVQDATNDGGQSCTRCRAWLGCLGLEPTPHLFVEHIVEVFRHVRRVLHPSGTVWLNLGDCYISNPHGTSPSFDPKYPGGRDRSEGGGANRQRAGLIGLKNKDLVMIPARVAIALQDDGWYLRSQISWIKRNGMPESACDRPTSMVEYIFLLSKSENYFYDRAAIMLPQAEHERTRRLREQADGLDTRYNIRRDDPGYGQVAAGRNGVARSVAARQQLAQAGVRSRRNSDWMLESFRGMATAGGEPLVLLVNPQPFALEYCKTCERIYRRREFRKLPVDAATNLRICACGESDWLSHFATFPEAMAEPCILAGASAYGACPHCGAPLERIVEKLNLGDWNADPSHKRDAGAVNSNARKRVTAIAAAELGWRRTCSHPLFESAAVPCRVLDPFAGSGTAGVVAMRHGHEFIGIERNAAYCALAEFRLKSVRSAGNESTLSLSSGQTAPSVRPEAAAAALLRPDRRSSSASEVLA